MISFTAWMDARAPKCLCQKCHNNFLSTEERHLICKRISLTGTNCLTPTQEGLKRL